MRSSLGHGPRLATGSRNVHTTDSINKVRQTIGGTDSKYFRSSEDVNINPQHLVGIIRPIVMDYVKSYLREFKVNFVMEIKYEVKKLMQLINSEAEYKRELELADVKDMMVNASNGRPLLENSYSKSRTMQKLILHLALQFSFQVILDLRENLNI